MRDLVLVFADLFNVEWLDEGPVRGLGCWRFEPARPIGGGWRGMLARGIGRPELEWVEPASLVSAAQPLGPASEPWLATPMHWQAGLTTVHVAGDARLRLSSAEALQWCDAFAADFGAQGLILQPAGTAGFLLSGLEASGAQTLEPTQLCRLPLAEAQPRGPGSSRLRGLMSEIELWLHEAEPNRARRARGERAVSSLWLWGGGAPPGEPPQPSAAVSRWPALFGEEATLRALARLSCCEVLPMAAIDTLLAADAESGCAVIEADGGAVADLTRDYVSIALEALTQHRLDRLTLVAQDRAVRAQRTDRWRTWRPRRRWTEALGLEAA
ncbi:MAG: hypothetical protein ACO3CV_06290 [Steroidobacteraceae bacterium]